MPYATAGQVAAWQWPQAYLVTKPGLFIVFCVKQHALLSAKGLAKVPSNACQQVVQSMQREMP